MTKDEALKLALEALLGNTTNPISDPEQAEIEDKAITAIKEALAQPEHQSTADKSKLEKVPAKGTLLAQPPEERNFCPRCGKRAGKNAWDVHTCSLPEEENT